MNELLRNWDILRLIRLLSGAGFAIYGIYSGDQFLTTLGLLLAFMAVINWSCCCSGGECGTSQKTKSIYKDMVKTYDPNK
ncbi:hypothetical protein I6E11_04615 [Bacteroides caecigallinarum]|uniref:hypothetical protein n=1 Tax=Bacteroides caecigallinarum TaxID=1411144 RepID=UPI001F1A9792|nr:hypothetical protein [Bacteroides caecigallinarum]MCF2593090.1 hypothetical protein [Bacteroides caecigallinarum]